MAIVSVIVNILILLCHIFIIAHMHTYMQMCLNIGAAAPCCALKCSPSTQLCDIQSSFARVDRNFSKVFNNCVSACVICSVPFANVFRWAQMPPPLLLLLLLSWHSLCLLLTFVADFTAKATTSATAFLLFKA